jgi:DNA polymerase IV
MRQRKIVHIDMDAFYASVEQRDNPDLRGKPVIVAWRGNRSVVCAASYEARKFGVRSAMPAVRAERLCPNAVFLPPDFTRYRAVSRETREIFRRHTDLIEPLSLDEAYLDVTINKNGLPTATQVARTIREEIRAELSLTASAGVASNKFLAKIASDWKKPDGLFVIQPDDVDSFLAPLPVGRIPGVGKVTEGQLKELNIATVADLRGLERSTLERRFGRYGARLHDLARGIDHACTVVLKLKTAEFKILTRSHTPAAPPTSCEELTAIALALRTRVVLNPHQRFRLVGIGLSNFRDSQDDAQTNLFATSTKSTVESSKSKVEDGKPY